MQSSRLGLISLTAASLSWASWPLVIVVGPAVGVLLVPFAAVAVITGLVAVVVGIQRRSAASIVSGALGLALVAAGTWLVIHALTHF